MSHFQLTLNRVIQLLQMKRVVLFQHLLCQTMEWHRCYSLMLRLKLQWHNNTISMPFLHQFVRKSICQNKNVELNEAKGFTTVEITITLGNLSKTKSVSLAFLFLSILHKSGAIKIMVWVSPLFFFFKEIFILTRLIVTRSFLIKDWCCFPSIITSYIAFNMASLICNS